MIVSGRGVGEVVATGAKSELGKIGTALGEIVVEPNTLVRSVIRRGDSSCMTSRLKSAMRLNRKQMSQKGFSVP